MNDGQININIFGKYYDGWLDYSSFMLALDNLNMKLN